ncbi:MAG: SufE family protein [Bdellovibrionales bacterium]
MSVIEKQKKIVKEFQEMTDWEHRYKSIIERGKQLEQMPESFKVDENLVKGCQSRVWIFAKLNPDNTIRFFADSEAMIVRGLVAVLLQVYSNEKPDEILSSPPTFIKELGFEGNLSPSRANGLYSMVKQIQFYATAFQALVASQTKN